MIMKVFVRVETRTEHDEVVAIAVGEYGICFR
jgi:hypothetical protein